jgi:hypothetical protein
VAGRNPAAIDKTYGLRPGREVHKVADVKVGKREDETLAIGRDSGRLVVCCSERREPGHNGHRTLPNVIAKRDRELSRGQNKRDWPIQNDWRRLRR